MSEDKRERLLFCFLSKIYYSYPDVFWNQLSDRFTGKWLSRGIPFTTGLVNL